MYEMNIPEKIYSEKTSQPALFSETSEYTPPDKSSLGEEQSSSSMDSTTSQF